MTTAYDKKNASILHIISVLEEYRVKYLIIGSYGAIIQDVDLPLTDIDFLPSRSLANAKRLAAALVELNVKYRKDGHPVSEPDATDMLRNDPRKIISGESWNFTSKFGDIDIVIYPGGFNGGYDEMVKRSKKVDVEVPGSGDVMTLPVADAYDIYLSKRNVSRPKDRIHLKAFREVVKQHHKKN